MTMMNERRNAVRFLPTLLMGLLLLFASTASAERAMVGDVNVAAGTVVVGDQTYRVQAGSRLYDEANKLIRLIDLNRIVIETYSDDNLVLMGDVESRRAADDKLDLIELHIETEEDE